MKGRGIFVAGAEMDAGKTTISLALLSHFGARLPRKAGFLKPLGQKALQVEGNSVGEDAWLVQSALGLEGTLEEACPVSTGSGAARKALLGEGLGGLEQRILNAYQKLRRRYDLVVVEGTGHPGVGGVFGLDNARVARLLRLPVLLVLDGGLGSTVDRYLLCSAPFALAQVPLLGVVVNRILPAKMEQTRQLLEPWFARRGVPVLGWVPQLDTLSKPSWTGLEEALRLSPLDGGKGLPSYAPASLIWGDGGVDSALQAWEENPQGHLVIRPEREDILTRIICLEQVRSLRTDPGRAIILAGPGTVKDWVVQAGLQAGLRFFASPQTPAELLSRYSRKVYKLQPREVDKIQLLVEHLPGYLDTGTLEARLRQPNPAEGTGKRQTLLGRARSFFGRFFSWIGLGRS